MLRVIFFISLFGALFNLISGECCQKKLVGGQTYHLVGDNDNDATSSLGCKNACSYTLENDTYQGQKYCFAPGKQEAKCLSSGGSNFSVKSVVPGTGFNLFATYSNFSCNTRTIITEFGHAEFPNEIYCGPQVTLCADSLLGTPHFSCCKKTTYSFGFPNLFILPDKTGSYFAKGCKIEIEPLPKPIDLIPEKPSGFYTFVDSWRARADSNVVWENDDCPPQDQAIIGNRPIRPFTYFDYCGKYTISADSFYPSPEGKCQVQSDEYPIPNWNITKTDTGCEIKKVDFLEFFVFVDSWGAVAVATVTWEYSQQCPTQKHLIIGSHTNTPFVYYDTCGKYTITANSKGGPCTKESNEYPIPNWRIINASSGCIIEKFA